MKIMKGYLETDGGVGGEEKSLQDGTGCDLESMYTTLHKVLSLPNSTVFPNLAVFFKVYFYLCVNTS